MSFFRPFDHYSYANDLGRCYNIEVQQFCWSRGHKDWGSGQHPLELVEGFLSLDGPSEALSFF